MNNDASHKSKGYSRRRFLGGLGAGAATAVAAGAAHLPGVNAAAAAGPPPGRFGRMFDLPAFAEANQRVMVALLDLGQPGGLMDARDQLERGPQALITDPALSRNNPDNPTHTAGTTFMGQFMDHDITFDTTSRLGTPTPPEAAPNARTPAFDLDSVYGAGWVASPQLYDPNEGITFRVESGGRFEDVPRTADGQAILGDPRNDETVMIAGLQLAVMLFHNRAVDLVRSQGRLTTPGDIFTAARQLTTWHYQWLILHEFLPLFVGQAMASDILAHGRRYYTPALGQAYIPVEFSGAAYRFGHSITRPSYRANLRGDNGRVRAGIVGLTRRRGR